MNNEEIKTNTSPLYLIYSPKKNRYYGENGTESTEEEAFRYYRLGDAMKTAANINGNLSNKEDSFKVFPIYK